MGYFILGMILVAVICAGSVAAFILVNKNKQSQSKINHLEKLLDIYAADEEDSRNEIAELKKSLNDLQQRTENLQEALNRRSDKIAELKTKIAELDKNKAVDDVRSEAAEDQLNMLLKQIAETEEKYLNMKELVAQIEESYVQRVDGLGIVQQEKDAATKQLDEILATYGSLQDSVAALNHDKNKVQEELEALKQSHAAALKALMRENQNNVQGWELNVSPKEKKLIALLDELIDLYPEIASDLSNIKWKRVWLPKIQDLANREGLDGMTGIYRITVKEDSNSSYVGQAVNIKERWYQHIKKMIGVDSKGSEKLYEYTPDEVLWEVVEEVDRSKLNEREHYWIEWWSCKEFGLNKKR